MIPKRAQIASLPGGDALVQALDALDDALGTQPFRIGANYIRTGTGSPEGAVVGTPGDLYLRTDGSTSTTLYVKTSGTSNTGWTAK